MITEKDARAGAARDMGFLAELDFQIRDNHKLTSEVMRLDDENAKLRKLVQRMWPVFIGEKRATFADRLHVRAEIDELGIVRVADFAKRLTLVGDAEWPTAHATA